MFENLNYLLRIFGFNINLVVKFTNMGIEYNDDKFSA